MGTTRNLIVGLGAGAGLMYMMDPGRGRRRRALVRDKMYSAFGQSGRGLDKAWRDAANRSHAVISAARGFTQRSWDAPDEVLAARLRSKLGRVASHPHAIHVTARGGTVRLEGPVLTAEIERILETLREVEGVHEIDNRLEAHETAESISSLQGGRPRPGDLPEYAQTNWTPSWRAAATFGGTYLLVRGLRRGGFFGMLSGFAGTGLLVRALANMPLSDFFGAGDHRGIHVDKAINVLAPVGEVYTFWKNYQNFPRFMTHVKEVRDLGNGRWHWVAEGPGGASVTWDGEVTHDVPNQLLAWRSLPGSQVDNWGSVRFDPNPDGGTRITVRMSYAPPAGMLGHAVASLFRKDPRHELNDDLVRLKSLFEYGKTRAHGERVNRQDFRAPAEGI